MLEEVLNLRQIEGEPKRRWFSDDYFDLIVWFEKGNIIGFQLSYGRFKDEHALTWHKQFGYGHYRVDDGEGRPGKPKSTPVLLPDGNFDYEKMADVFKRESTAVDKNIAGFIMEKILHFRVIG